MKYILVIAATFILTACQSGKDQLISKIKKEEAVLMTDDRGINDSIANLLIADYQEYSTSYPKDKQSAEYVFKAAELLNGTAKFTQAIHLFEQLPAQFPDFDKNAEALLICGFISENNLMDTAMAGNYYRMVITGYPNNRLKEHAELALSHLGKTPEELVKEFEAKNKK